MTNYAPIEITGITRYFHRRFRAGTFQRVELPVGTWHLAVHKIAFLHWAPVTDIARAPVSMRGGDRGFSITTVEQSLTLDLSVSCLADIIQICPQLVQKLTDGHDDRLSLGIGTSLSSLQAQIWQRIVAAATTNEDGAEHIFDVCVELLLSGLVQPRPQPAEQLIDPAVAGANYEALARAVAYVEDNLGQKIDVGEIARAANLSPFYFSRLFRAACGISVYGFVIEKRLQLARHLLQSTDLPLSTIALETGFSSQSHLTTSFRERFGATPSVYRSKASS